MSFLWGSQGAECDQKLQTFTLKPWVRKRERGNVTCKTTFLGEKCRFLTRAAHSERMWRLTLGTSPPAKVEKSLSFQRTKASEVLPEISRVKLNY